MAEGTSSLDARADALERKMSDELDVVISKSALFNMADGQLGATNMGHGVAKKAGKLMLMGDDPRLPQMPAKPTLLDYFKTRAGGTAHLLQSANLALKKGMPEKIILACLLHDIANCMFIKSDHGYWGAQLIEPYVDEEISWAIRAITRRCASSPTNPSATPIRKPISIISAPITCPTITSRKTTRPRGTTNGT